jgi:chromosomal replication initiator protein
LREDENPQNDQEASSFGKKPSTLPSGAIPQNYKFEYTFENFIVGNSNKFAHAACTAVAARPAENYNPLFIYGPSGLGKTHLMSAVVNEIKKTKPETRVIYIKGDDFTNQMIEALAKQEMYKFHEKYRNCDILLIDDIQFIAGKTSTQEEFFHTFNTLFESGKQIIISADCPAARITSMDERLKSRFAQGMTVELTAPCYEMRMAILRQKIQSWKKNLLSDEVLDFLARNITKSVRTLEGALVRTGIAASLNNTCPTIASLRSDLADLMNLKPSTGLSIADIKQRVANEFGIRVEDLDSRRRLASLAHPRQVAMFLARKHTSSSLQDIGAAFGRDHSTVLHALRSVETKLETDAPLRHMVEQFAETFA